ncbi:MAG TPA: carbohydrate kinase family protein [Chloroflexi bacterium]|jgi:sugar/nucleoside kinase (ribokinase family)|nr:carbohydrate kinase family protein [Chloroflexota bacterium]
MIDAIAAGHLCVDIIPEITDPATATSDSFLVPGRLTEVGRAILSTGGSVANTGLALHRLGLDVRLVARLGDDVIAGITRDILERHDRRLTAHLSVAHGEPSSYTIVISPPGVDRTFLHCPGTNNTFGPEDLPVTLLAETRVLHLGYPPLMRRMYADGGVELAMLMKRAKEAGATTSLDLAMPDPAGHSGRADWRGLLKRVLPYVDIAQPNVEELLFMLHRDRLEAFQCAPEEVLDALRPAAISALAEELLAMGVRMVAIKLGHRGFYLRTATELSDMGRGAPASPAAWTGRELWAPCFRVPVAGTVGSGDATSAGLITGLLRGQSAEEALTTAVAVGACNVEAADAISGVRPWDETQRRIAAGWERLDARVTGDGWHWDATHSLFRGPADG